MLLMVILELGSWSATYRSLKGRFPLLEEVNLQSLHHCEKGQKKFRGCSRIIPTSCRHKSGYGMGPQDVSLKWLKDGSHSVEADNNSNSWAFALSALNRR